MTTGSWSVHSPTVLAVYRPTPPTTSCRGECFGKILLSTVGGYDGFNLLPKIEILYFSSMEVELRAYIKPSSPNGRSDSLTYADIWLDRKSITRHYYPKRWVLRTWGFGDLEIFESWWQLEQESCEFYAKGLPRVDRDIPAYQAKMLALNQETLVRSCRPRRAMPLE